MHKMSLTFLVVMIALVVGSGAALAATVRCEGGPCEGTARPDTLNGSPQRDSMYGFGAEDNLYGNRGDDILRGGRGADELYGGPGSDGFYGEGGADRFSGGSGRDRMTGGPGRDTLYGGTDNDTIAVQDGSYDVVDCGEGDYDAVVVDRDVDRVRNCENVYWQGQ